MANSRLEEERERLLYINGVIRLWQTAFSIMKLLVSIVVLDPWLVAGSRVLEVYGMFTTNHYRHRMYNGKKSARLLKHRCFFLTGPHLGTCSCDIRCPAGV